MQERVHAKDDIYARTLRDRDLNLLDRSHQQRPTRLTPDSNLSPQLIYIRWPNRQMLTPVTASSYSDFLYQVTKLTGSKIKSFYRSAERDGENVLVKFDEKSFGPITSAVTLEYDTK